MVDFDFQRYVQSRQSDRVDSRGAQAYREYAFKNDVTILRTLSRTRVVELALKATASVERSWLEGEVLGRGVKVGPGAHPAVREASHDAARALGMGTPPVYLSAATGVPAASVVVSGHPGVVLSPELVERLDGAALRFVLGRQLGHLQNSHGPYLTCALALRHLEASRWGWVVRPAGQALGIWQHWGDVTADRAGLLACGELAAARRGLEALVGEGRLVEARMQALELFAGSSLYRQSRGEEGGEGMKEVDSAVERVLKLVEAEPPARQ